MRDLSSCSKVMDLVPFDNSTVAVGLKLCSNSKTLDFDEPNSDKLVYGIKTV